MIVLIVSAQEARDLIAGKPSKDLQKYVRSHLKLEECLPDDDLPHTVVLEKLDDSYSCVYRCYSDARSAERALMRVTAADREAALEAKSA